MGVLILSRFQPYLNLPRTRTTSLRLARAAQSSRRRGELLDHTGKRRRSAGDDDMDDDDGSDAEWRAHDDGGVSAEDDDGDGGCSGVAGVGIVGDTDWRERAARARMEQRKSLARMRKIGDT